MTQRLFATSLRAKLAVGAALLGAVTLVTAAILYAGMSEVARRLDTALASEARMARYSSLSTQASTFLVVVTEAIQTGQSAEVRADRLASVTGQIRDTFVRLQADVETAVEQAGSLGLDEQSRYGSQSLGLARMEALLEHTLSALSSETDDRDQLRAQVDAFASGFDPLLNQAVNTEVLFRNAILSKIDRLRRSLMWTAIAIAVLTVPLVLGFYLVLIRPQFLRLDQLRAAAQQIGQEDFTISLPDSNQDEIGQLYSETSRMAAALDARRTEVQAEWARLNEVIAERTKDLSAANIALEEIDENRRRLFADISHELRTPLTVILMEAQLGQRGAPDPERAFRIIETRAARLNRRIDDLLRVARSESGQLALEIGKVDLSLIVSDAIEEVQAEIDSAGMRLEVSRNPRCEVQCDANWARQTIVSLIRNGIRHAREGGLVRLDPEKLDGLAGIAVIDNGPGLAAADQARVFERFVQGGQGDAKGFGVGLGLARWVTQAQGGEIELISPVPRDTALGASPGTNISVRFPHANS